MNDLPFDEPLRLRSYYGSDLENLFATSVPKCRDFGESLGLWNCMVLRRVTVAGSDSIAIESLRNGRFLEATSSGDCHFVNVVRSALQTRHLFALEAHVMPAAPNHLYFVSRLTGNPLQASSQGIVTCAERRRTQFAAWRLVAAPPGVLAQRETVKEAENEDRVEKLAIEDLKP